MRVRTVFCGLLALSQAASPGAPLISHRMMVRPDMIRLPSRRLVDRPCSGGDTGRADPLRPCMSKQLALVVQPGDAAAPRAPQIGGGFAVSLRRAGSGTGGSGGSPADRAACGRGSAQNGLRSMSSNRPSIGQKRSARIAGIVEQQPLRSRSRRTGASIRRGTPSRCRPLRSRRSRRARSDPGRGSPCRGAAAEGAAAIRRSDRNHCTTTRPSASTRTAASSRA